MERDVSERQAEKGRRVKEKLLGIIALLLCTDLYATPVFQAVVDTHGSSGSFPTITAALQQAPDAAESPYSIFIQNGIYRERILIDKPNITLIGEDRDKTIITAGAYAGQELPGSEELRGTFRTATLSVRAPDFSAQNLTIENSFDFLANDALSAEHPQKIRGTQAVALAIDGNADRVALNGVRVSGYQDTLYVNSGRSYFLDSVIEGNVDFIFGAGTALFENSDIVTRPRAHEMATAGYVTAPSTDIKDAFGLVFLNCRLLKDPGVAPGSIALGRPWHPTKTFADGRYADPDAIGASVFIDTYMDNHISPTGWASMRGTGRDGSKSLVFEPADSRFFEHNSYGPGAIITGKRRQLPAHQVRRYTRSEILGDWMPEFTQRNTIKTSKEASPNK